MGSSADLAHEHMRAETTLQQDKAAKANPLATQVGGNHYKKFKIQPIEFITANELTFLEGCIIKRVCRHRSKNGREDLEKAIHELQLLLALEYDRG